MQWLMSNVVTGRTSACASRSRRAFLEQLESRYALAAPEANHDLITVEKNTLFEDDAPGVLANDEDPEFGPLTVVEVNGSTANVGNPIAVSGGTLTIASNGGLEFDPAEGFDGFVSFTYKIRDAELLTDNGTGLIQVVPDGVPIEHWLHSGRPERHD